MFHPHNSLLCHFGASGASDVPTKPSLKRYLARKRAGWLRWRSSSIQHMCLSELRNTRHMGIRNDDTLRWFKGLVGPINILGSIALICAPITLQCGIRENERIIHSILAWWMLLQIEKRWMVRQAHPLWQAHPSVVSFAAICLLSVRHIYLTYSVTSALTVAIQCILASCHDMSARAKAAAMKSLI